MRQQMNNLTAQIDALFRRYAADLDKRRLDGVQVAKQFRVDMDLLIGKYGQPAIDAALDEVFIGQMWPSASLH
jgi:hypothetical protein